MKLRVCERDAALTSTGGAAAASRVAVRERELSVIAHDIVYADGALNPVFAELWSVRGGGSRVALRSKEKQ